MKSWTPPTNEMIEKVLTSVKKETDRQYFFSKLNNPLWIEPLRKRGYFDNPPRVKHLPDGLVQYPYWPEMSYLVTIVKEATDQVIEIILSLPETDNPRVYEDVISIALKLEGAKSAELLPKIIESIDLDDQFLAYSYPELLQHWAVQGNIDEALQIAELLIQFQEDPRARDKQQLREKDPNSFGVRLEPAPRFQQWDYQQILEKGVRPLTVHEPYQVARILIDAVNSMIYLGMHREDLKKVRDEDYSEIWCRRLDKSDRDNPDVKEILIQTLTFACEQVYDQAPESINSLDQALRSHRWKIFRRLCQHLYASHPNDQTFPWIRKQILGQVGYSKRKHRYEFQLMIRKASEYFGPRLLSKGEQKDIFDAILSGPSKEEFRESMGEHYSEEAFQQRQSYFHFMQLRPFAALLSREVQRYFDELKGKVQSEDITDDSYSPFGKVTAGAVSYQSPKSAEELENLTDEEILTYLNKWDNEHWDTDNWQIKINISALAGVFQSLFKEKIVHDRERLVFWLANRDRILRPIYVTAMLQAMLDLVKDKNFSNLEQWIKFCSWILSHPDSERIEGQPEPRDESRSNPDWGSSRRAVIDFIDACVNKDINAPISARDGLANLLQQVCTQFDGHLDQDRPVLLNQDDPIAEAINNTRSLALESLVNLGFWVRRHLPEDNLPEVTSILEKRIADDAEIPLTRPERALLGMHFGNHYILNRDWTTRQRDIFFPREINDVWRDVFSSYIHYNRPVKLMFEILRGEFEYAIENLHTLVDEKEDSKELIDRLGQHLFTYYLWEVYPLSGDESLLERFYDKTNSDRKRWALLFDHVGRSLRNSGKHLDKALTDRVIAYFDLRFEAAEALELQEFTFWLEAECLDPDWRLQSYSKILDLSQEMDLEIYQPVKALKKLLPTNLALVVECFSKITGAMDQSTQIFVSADDAKPILKAGLNAEDPQVRGQAEHARENLLRFGRFDYLDID